MREEFLRFMQCPDHESYLAVREQIIQSGAYQPYSDEMRAVSDLYESEKFEEARDALQGALGNLILSPRAHELLGFLHHKLGNEDAARLELMIARACIEGILATGDGSEDEPYLVVRTSDEHDVIEHLEKELRQQSLTHNGDRHLDLIECTDGSEYWFDITDAYNQLSKSLAP